MTHTTTCRWDRESKKHLTREHQPECVDRACKGCQPCTHDDAGNTVRHCRTRLRCTSHLGWTEHTCPECVGKIRTNLTKMLNLLTLMPAVTIEQAIGQGVDSEPANLAGPHADYVSAQWRLVNADRNGEAVEELDKADPYTCLTMHERSIREDLGHDAETLVSPTIAAACGYIAWVLTDLARSEEHVTSLRALMSDTSHLLTTVETAAALRKMPQRGAPCPICVEEGIAAERLNRVYGHWCEHSGCRQVHYLDESGDVWRCPINAAHEWTHEAYTKYVETRTARVAS